MVNDIGLSWLFPELLELGRVSTLVIAASIIWTIITVILYILNDDPPDDAGYNGWRNVDTWPEDQSKLQSGAVVLQFKFYWKIPLE